MHVGTRTARLVEFWFDHNPDATPALRTFRVYGTSHIADAAAAYVGTAITPGGQFVWHLMEKVDGGVGE